jgi:hypothetical protein
MSLNSESDLRDARVESGLGSCESRTTGTNDETRSINDGKASSFFRDIMENWEFVGQCILIIIAWGVISSTVIVFSLNVSAPINTLMFASSLCSLVASGLILLSGYYSGKKHRTVRSLRLLLLCAFPVNYKSPFCM